MRISKLPLEDAAKHFAGNWQKFENFSWYDKPKHAHRWGIYYVCTRIDCNNPIIRSNWEVVKDKFHYHTTSAHVERHNHWAAGWIEGLAVKVYNYDGDITKAFKKLYAILKQIDDYPILDEHHYAKVEIECRDEAWETWVKSDFIEFLNRRFEINVPDNYDLRSLFENLANKYNEPWELDSSGVWIYTDKIVARITVDDIKDIATCSH